MDQIFLYIGSTAVFQVVIFTAYDFINFLRFSHGVSKETYIALLVANVDIE